jgi:ferredoxin
LPLAASGKGEQGMRPSVDHDLCIGCGNCAEICPEVFELREDGYSWVVQEAPDESLRDCVEDAEESCPVEAISIED